MIDTAVAAELRSLQARVQVTQADLADAAGISQSQMSKVLRGKRPLTLGQFAAACERLGADPADVFARAAC